MTDYVLKRAYTDQGTFGKVYRDGEFLFYSVERPWMGNQPFKSCIPAGEYQLVKTISPRFGESYALSNYQMGVGVNKGLRTHILIHPANRPSELAGCIGLGFSLGVVKSEWAVINSGRAVKAFYDLLDESEKNTLRIE